jgi:Secretion system C-terminal sorting domain
MKTLIAILSLFFAVFTVSAQNCGMVSNFTYTATNNNNGTSTYNFQVTIHATSGGSKSVNLTIQCGNNIFVSNQCEASMATARVINYGPYTVNTCNSGMQLLWTGYTNSNCGGAACTSQQSYIILPVELTSFNAAKIADAAMLDWETASEKNNDKFIVERSSDGRAYEQVGEVAGKGTTTETSKYKYVDNNPTPGVNYYRLKQVDFNGEFEYSPVSSVEFKNDGEIMIYPTIVSEELNIELPEAIANEEVLVDIFSMQGAKVFSANLQGSTVNNVSMPTLQPGQYLVHVSSGQINKQTIIIKH